jgi:4-hydroxythreonine-4-phosphate dehydrogenase
VSPPPVRIGVTVGDPAGIGPEVVSKALRAGVPGLPAGTQIRVYGDLEAVERAGGLPAGTDGRTCRSAAVEPGKPDPAAAAGVVEAIRAAARDCLEGGLDAMATAPISKQVMGEAGFAFPGHTELLADEAGRDSAVMLLVGGSLRVALATIHLALRDVPAQITRPRLERTLAVLDADLRGRFAIAEPRIAVCGLNPHAGEAGRFGDEEAREIAPAVEAARATGIDASGPLSADSLFHLAAQGRFDAVLAMYHDQGLGPLKLHAFGRAVNVTLGLPLIRTSVDHGTAFDIAAEIASDPAGGGCADAGSMAEAIRLAAELAGNERKNG